MASANFEMFRRAIQEKAQIFCEYKGFDRALCPHVLGYGKHGEHCLAFQFDGESSSGLPPGGEWRCLILDDVTSCRIIPGPWHTGEGHNKPQTCVKDVVIEVVF